MASIGARFSALVLAGGLVFVAGLAGCSSTDSGPPPCGSRAYGGTHLVPGPAEAGFDAELEARARRYDRVFHGLSSFSTGLNADLVVPKTATAARDAIAAFADDDAAWDFEAATGMAPPVVVGSWQKSAGLYAGVGIAADAFRYAVLRDEGYACDAIEQARTHLVRSLEALHVASTIGGVPGVIARSLSRKDLPGDGMVLTTTPLFDENGAPLPPEKNNGTWREDNSGMYPNYIWEDSTSRDMLVGWAMAFAGAWEVIKGDATFESGLKDTLRADARAIGNALKTVRASGYDLEIPDADGRTTFHGYLNENAFERGYVPGVDNGFYAGMAIGIVAALAYTAEDPELDRYIAEELLAKRDLPSVAVRGMLVVDLGVIANFSNYNMSFTGLWLGTRYLRDEVARGKLRVALDRSLYDIRDHDRQPKALKQTFFDFIFAAGMADAGPSRAPIAAFDAGAVARGLETLGEFPRAPFWELGITNCDDAEITSGTCTLSDGTVVHIADGSGRGDTLVTNEPIPMRVRPPSNYFWRSNPYAPNGDGDGTRLLPGVDFRVAYWMGRHIRGD